MNKFGQPSQIEKNEELSPALQKIKNMELSLNDEDFDKNAHEGLIDRETSSDAFIRLAKKLADNENPGPNTWGAMLKILERDSMKGHPNMGLFENAVKELAEKNNKELKVREGYWEGLTKTEEE